MFSCNSFIVLALTFRSLIYFELIFVYGIGEGSNFFLLHVDIQVSLYNLLKRSSFPPLNGLGTLVEIIWPYTEGLFQGFLFYSIGLYVCS